MIFFTGDKHLGHAKILYHRDRPYKNVEEMDEELIWQHNNRVGHNDTVYDLGDVTLLGHKDAAYYFSRLRGRIKVLANPSHHDRRWLRWAMSNSAPPNQFVSASGHPVELLPPIVLLEFGEYSANGHDKAIVLCHFPLAQWERKHYGAWHLHAHCHGSFSPGGLSLDVGIDAMAHNFHYAPISQDEVANILQAREREMAKQADFSANYANGTAYD